MAIKSIVYKDYTLDISYEILNQNSKKDFIVLHGWGSNKKLMRGTFSNYLDDFRHIYIDLPGFGGSMCNKVLYTSDYAKIIELFLSELDSSKEVILGHSFGGKVATLLKPKLLVLVSSAGIFVKKPLKIKIKIIIFKILKFFKLTKFRSFFVADDAKSLNESMYQTFKNVVDEDFTHEFLNYSGKTMLFWGKDDTATPLSSAKKIDELIKNSTLKVYDGDHYFFMNYAKEVSKEINNARL